jgi:translation initiation factor IF-2
MPNYQKAFEAVLQDELPPKRVKAVAAELAALIEAPTPAKAVETTPADALKIIAKALNAAPAKAPASPAVAPKKAVKAKAKAKPASKAEAKTKAKRPAGKRGLPAATSATMSAKKSLYWALFRQARGDAPETEDAQRIRDGEASLVKEYKAKIAERLGAKAAPKKAAPKAKKAAPKAKKSKPAPEPEPAPAVEPVAEPAPAAAANGAAPTSQGLSEEQRRALNL